MTPTQKELLVKGLLSDWAPLEGSGQYAAARSMSAKGWINQQWSVNRNTITQAGKDALALNSPPVEIFDGLLLKDGRPIARILPGQLHLVEELINAN
ncbi:hypothetical protein [Mesorhizobium sp. WSM2239]|uniref:Uncharacterized protein n=2 Tax=unclassified Mesorhizobium TaxID=325217 RepID=A0AAU8DEU5_9HYPH